MATAKVPVTFSPVDSKKVDAALARIQAKAKGIDFGGGAGSINKLSRPLGKITGQASEFQKSLEASNARVLAFGASVAVINKLSQAFGALVSNTIKVEATFAKINTILGGTNQQLQKFGDGIFKVAQQTGTSFDQVAEGALELARQGLSVEQSLNRVSTALKLVRVSGIDSQKAVSGLTAAIKGFEGAGLTVAQIADKLAEVDTKFAVSTEDLINGLERASASARVAGVSFDELLGVVTTVQERTQRGGAVIGNAFKTIFARLSRTDTLDTLEQLGIDVLDASGNVRGAIPLFQDLAVELDKLGLKSLKAGEIIQKVAGVRQRDILISLVEDLNSGQSQFAKSLQVSAGAAGALDAKNEKLNQTLEALINNLTVGGQKLASVLGEIGFTDAASDILKTFSKIVNGITDLLQGDSMGAKFAQGLVKGIGSVLTGPGLALIGAIFIKLFIDLAKFGATSLKQILGINKAAMQQHTLQQSVLQTLHQNEDIQREILKLEGNKVAQEKLLLKIYNQQAAALARVQKAAATVTPGLFRGGFRGGEGGVGKTGRGAGGYVAAEARDVSRGVGGAPANSKVVSIPNFAFGSGKRGTMVANSSEYFVPNYAGGGDAIFNKNMVKAMGLPSGARKINAAGGFIPNFADTARMPLGEVNRALGNAKMANPTSPKLRSEKAALLMRQRQLRREKRNSRGFKFDSLGKIGVLSAFDRGGSSIANTTVSKLSRTEQGRLKPLVGLSPKDKLNPSAPVSVKGIQNRSLENLDKSKVTNFRKNIDTAFAPALIDFAKTLIGGVGIQNDEMGEFVKKVRSAKGNLFSTSVEGGIFESAIQLGTKKLKEIRTFLGATGNDRSPFDFEETGNASENLIKAFQFNTGKGKLLKADAKRSSTPDAVASLIGKSLRDGVATQFRRGAGGYIPNFASGGLDEAVAREQAAGMPINQIRINQSGKLRNAQNPMGLAVTNTRDEPTGAIPNFARLAPKRNASKKRFGGAEDKVDNLGDSADEASGALDASIGKIFALQLATSALTSTFAEQGGKMEQFGSSLSSAINTMLVLSTVGASPLGALTPKKGGGIKGLAAFTKGTKGLTRVFGILKGVAGPVALGFTAVDMALKAFTGKGVLGYAKDGLVALGLAASESSKKFASSAEEFAKKTSGLGVGASVNEALSQLQKEARASSLGVEAEELTESVLKFSEVSALRPGKVVEKIRNESGRVTSTETGTLKKEQLKPIQEAIGSLLATSGQDIVDAIPGISDENVKAYIKSQGEIIDKLDGDVKRALLSGLNEQDNMNGAAKSAKAAIIALFVRAEKTAEKEAKEVEDKITRVEQGDAATQLALAASRRRNQIDISAARTSARRATMNRTPMGSVQRARSSFASENDNLETEAVKARLKIRTDLIEQAKLQDSIKAIDKEKLDIILAQVHEYGSIEEIQKAISEIEGVQVKDLDKQVRLATVQNTQLEETLTKDRQILEIRKQQAIETAKANKGLAKYSQDAQQKLINQAEDLPNILATNLEKSMADTFGNLANGAYDTVGDAFLQIALNFGQELQSQINQRMATQATNALFGEGTGGGGLLDGLSNAITGGGGGSSGGGGGGGFMSGIKSFFGFNSGGMVSGGSGVRDDVPAALTGGEYVIKKSAVQKYGKGFLDQLNSSSISGMNSGGFINISPSTLTDQKVTGKYQPDSAAQPGGFFTPGTRGQGAIIGKQNLLDFSRQQSTSGATDVIRSGGSSASIDLETQSSRLTTFGRFRDSPARRALKQAQEQAYNLYLAKLEDEERVRQAKKERSNIFKNAVKGAFMSAGVSAGVGALGGMFNKVPIGPKNAPFPGMSNILGPYSSTPQQAGDNLMNTYSGLFSNQAGSTASSSNTLTGNSLIDNNPFLPQRANGGAIGSSTNALLMGGEYVLSSAAASKIGKQNLDDINMMRYSNGGAAGSGISDSSNSSSGDGKSVGEVNITINMEKGDASVDENSNGNADPTQTKEFAKRIKDVVVGVINEEKRVSGSLFTRRK